MTASATGVLFYAVIPGEPVGKGRPRVARIGDHARAYTPKKTETWEGNAAARYREAWGDRAPLDVPVVVAFDAVSSRPKRLLRRKDPDGRLWRPGKPDVDNCAKAVLDALTDAGVIRDDVQVVQLAGRSLYAARVEGPRVEVWLWLAPAMPAANE